MELVYRACRHDDIHIAFQDEVPHSEEQSAVLVHQGRLVDPEFSFKFGHSCLIQRGSTAQNTLCRANLFEDGFFDELIIELFEAVLFRESKPSRTRPASG